MSDDSAPLTITVEASDETRSKPLVGRTGIDVAITVTLPTWEGSDGPSLDGPAWATQVGDLTMIVAGAAGATVRMIRDATVADKKLAKLAASVAELRQSLSDFRTDAREEFATLDSTVDAAHQRLDAVNAPGVAEIERQRKDPQAAWKRAHGYHDIRIIGTVTPPPSPTAVLIVHENTGHTAWLTHEEAERRVEAGILEPAP